MGNCYNIHGRKAVIRTEIETLEDRLENYRANIGMLVEKIREEVTEATNPNSATKRNLAK